MKAYSFDCVELTSDYFGVNKIKTNDDFPDRFIPVFETREKLKEFILMKI